MYRNYHNTPELDRRQFLALGFPFFFRRGRSVRLDGAKFDVIRHGRSNRVFIHVHGNEETARQILRAHMKTRSGIAYLIEGDKRNVAAGGGLLTRTACSPARARNGTCER